MMSRVVLATAVMLGGVLAASGQVQGTPDQESQGIISQAGTNLQTADPQTRAAIRTALASAINDTLTQARFGRLAGQLGWRKHNAAGTLAQEDFSGLDHALAEFREDYRLMYGQAFEFHANLLRISEIDADPASKVALVWLPLRETYPGAPWFAGVTDYDYLMWRGAASPAGRPVIVMENEGSKAAPRWRIDTPRDMTDRQWAERLTRYVQTLIAEEPAWPTDPKALASDAGMEVLKAFMDTSAPGRAGSMAQAGMRSTASEASGGRG
jgi:hypothetical protein